MKWAIAESAKNEATPYQSGIEKSVIGSEYADPGGPAM